VKYKLFILFFLIKNINQVYADKLIDLEGFWSNDCKYNGSAIKHNKSNNYEIELASNQIYILVNGVENSEKSYYDIYYIEPLDLGVGGSKIKWSDVSKDIPIGKVLNIKKTSYEFEFYGLKYIDEKEDLNKYMYHEFTEKKELISKCE